MPAWVFVRDGLDIEEQQLVLSNVRTLIGNLSCRLLQAAACIRHQEEGTEDRPSGRVGSGETQQPHAGNQEVEGGPACLHARGCDSPAPSV